MRFALVFVSAAALSICSAAADPQTTSTAPAAAQPAPAASSDANKMVCKSTPAKIGSRIGGGRECRTQREWDDISAQNQRELEKMQASGNLSPQGH